MEIRKCPYCGKIDPRDKKHRPVIFCCREHYKLYTYKTRFENKHFCSVCGKEAKFNKKLRRWDRTCGNSDCIRKCQQIGQTNGTEHRKKINLPFEEFYRLYVIENKSREFMAKLYKCSEANIKKFIRQHNIIKGISQRYVHTRATKLERYGNETFVNIKKRQKTCLKKYGVKSNLLLQSNTKNVSKSETQWLDSLNIPSLIRQKHIKTKSKLLIVDGYNPETNTIYEFLGDYWHGNPNKFKPNQLIFQKHKLAKTVYRETFERFALLKSLGYNVIYIWESEYNHKKPYTVYN